MHIKKASYFLLALVVLAALVASIKNTMKWTRDFSGLTILASLSNKDLSYNPFSNDFYWVSPDMALYILKTQEYPYNNCANISFILESCNEPRVAHSAAFIGLFSSEADVRMLDLIQFLIKKGEPLDDYASMGFTALQAAILANEPELVSILLDAGSDPYLTIKGKSSVYGKNSLEFVDALLEKNMGDFSEIKELLLNNLSNHKMQSMPDGT